MVLVTAPALQVLAEVQCWDLPPLAERYRRACQSLALGKDPPVSPPRVVGKDPRPLPGPLGPPKATDTFHPHPAEPHPLLLKLTELQEQSPGLGVEGGLALRPPHLPPLLRALKLQAPLRQLRLRGCGLPDAMAGDLLATLATLPALTLLDLAGNRLGAQGLRQLLPRHPDAAGAFQVGLGGWNGGGSPCAGFARLRGVSWCGVPRQSPPNLSSVPP